MRDSSTITRGKRLSLLGVALVGTLSVLGADLLTSTAARADTPVEPVTDNAWCTQGIARNPDISGDILLGTLLDPVGAVTGGFNPAKAAAERLGGASPAIYSYYVKWQTPNIGGPGSIADPTYDNWGFLDTLADGVQHMGGILGVNLSLGEGLGVNHINAKTAADLANHLKTYNTLEGVPVILRIGPEMNGNWSVWDQQPEEFKRAFKVIADAVHTISPATQTVWAPAFGAGYPWGFHGQADEDAYKKQYGLADYNDLDTNHDGHITIDDDPYSPYWPTDDPGHQSYVDWVGMSEYHFGDAYPWGADTIPPAEEFEGELRGTYHPSSQPMTTSDFYSTYTGSGTNPDGTPQRDKPLMIAETGAWYTPDTAAAAGAASELDIKTTWWDSIKDALPNLPRLRALVFFDATQDPASVTDPTAFSPPLTTRIQWQYDRTPELVTAFNAAFGPADGFAYATGNPCLPHEVAPPTTAPPTTTPPSTTPSSTTAPPTTSPPTTPAPTTVVPTSTVPTVAPPTPVPGTVVVQTVCTTARKAALIHGRQKVTRLTKTCVTRQVRATWTVGTVCTTATVTKVVRGRRTTSTVRTCKRAPVQKITVLKVLRTAKPVVTYVDVKGRAVTL